MNWRPLTPAPPPPLLDPTDTERARLDTAERVLALTVINLGNCTAPDDHTAFTTDEGRVAVPTYTLDTLRHILGPVCHDNDERIDQLIREGISSGHGVTVTWLTLRTEWAIDDTLFKIQFDAVGGNGYLDVRQQRDGSYIVSAHEGRDWGDVVSLTLPASFVRDLATDPSTDPTSTEHTNTGA